MAITKEEFERASDAIFIAIGRAINEWSLIETELYYIFAYVIAGAQSTPSIAASFAAIQSFESKLSVVTEALYANDILSTGEVERFAKWKNVREDLRAAARNRNGLVHGSIVSPVPVMSGPPVAPPVWVPFFEETTYTILKQVPSKVRSTKRNQLREYTADDILVMVEEFRVLRFGVREYFDFLRRADKENMAAAAKKRAK